MTAYRITCKECGWTALTHCSGVKSYHRCAQCRCNVLDHRTASADEIQAFHDDNQPPVKQ